MWSPFERADHAFSICTVCIESMSNCNVLVISHFGFESGNLLLIASVPGHYFPLHFTGYVQDI